MRQEPVETSRILNLRVTEGMGVPQVLISDNALLCPTFSLWFSGRVLAQDVRDLWLDPQHHKEQEKGGGGGEGRGRMRGRRKRRGRRLEEEEDYSVSG